MQRRRRAIEPSSFSQFAQKGNLSSLWIPQEMLLNDGETQRGSTFFNLFALYFCSPCAHSFFFIVLAVAELKHILSFLHIVLFVNWRQISYAEINWQPCEPLIPQQLTYVREKKQRKFAPASDSNICEHMVTSSHLYRHTKRASVSEDQAALFVFL